MKKTIYNVAVLMEDQSQCDRMKQLCLDNGLPIWEVKVAFSFRASENNYFVYYDKDFFIRVCAKKTYDKSLVTESEFIELLKNHKG